MKAGVPLIIASLLSGVSTTVQSDPYVGFGIGSASYKADFSSLGGGSLDDNGTGSKLYGGYSFNKYFAAEASLYNFAEASVGAVEISPGNVASAAVDATGVGAYAVAMYPLNKKFNLTAKLGMLRWDAELRVNNSTASSDGNDVAYSLGASYAFTRDLLFAAEWESFNSDNPELSMLSLGFKFIFR